MHTNMSGNHTSCAEVRLVILLHSKKRLVNQSGPRHDRGSNS